jgi:hypothetical protein
MAALAIARITPELRYTSGNWAGETGFNTDAASRTHTWGKTRSAIDSAICLVSAKRHRTLIRSGVVSSSPSNVRRKKGTDGALLVL